MTISEKILKDLEYKSRWVSAEYFCNKYRVKRTALTQGTREAREKKRNWRRVENHKIILDEGFLLAVIAKRKEITRYAQKYYFVFSYIFNLEDAEIARLITENDTFNEDVQFYKWYEFIKYSIFAQKHNDSILNALLSDNMSAFVAISDNIILEMMKNYPKNMKKKSKQIHDELYYL